MKAKFSPSTAIAGCCDTNASRYALGHVCVSPAPDGKHVWLTACDSRTLACVKEPGTAIEPMACPAEAFKAPASKAKLPIYRENGHWVDRKNTIHPAEESPGRFPRADQVVPQDVTADYALLTIDAQLLLNLAKAINQPGGKYDDKSATAISLLLPLDEYGVVNKTIGVLGNAGFGVIMPLASTGPRIAEDKADKVRAFRGYVTEYVAEFKAFAPPEVAAEAK